MDATRSRRGTIALSLIIWGLSTWIASRLFGPGSTFIAFTSDSAIPVLMARHQGHTPFSLYYWGQDRFGAWPFLLASAWSGLTGWSWTAEQLSNLLISCAFAGAMAFTAFSGGMGWVAALSCAAALLLQASPRQYLLDLGQPYAWQLALIVATWLALRRLLQPNVKQIPAAALYFVLATLACWISATSGPLLFLLLLVEALRSLWKDRQEESQPPWSRFGLAAAVLATAGLTEWILIRGWYHRFAAAHYGWDHQTLLRGDIGHLRQNAVEVMRVWREGSSWLIAAWSVASVACLIFALVPWRRESPGSRNAASIEAWFLAVGASLLAWGNLAICIVVSHVRKGGYSDRYLCLTHVFLGAAAGLAVYGLAVRVLRFRHMNALAPLALLLSLLIALYARLPARAEDAGYYSLKELARTISDGRRSRVLLGDYWSVYALAALAPAEALIPLEPDSEEDPRTPFNQPILRALPPGADVLIVSRQPLPGSAQNPGEELTQYGIRLQLASPRPCGAAERSVWTYRIAGRQY